MFDIETPDNVFLREFARQSLQRFNSTATLLRYSNHICYVTDIVPLPAINPEEEVETYEVNYLNPNIWLNLSIPE